MGQKLEFISLEDWNALADACAARDGDWRAQARDTAALRAREAEDYELDQSMADKALGGVYGRRCKEIAECHVEEFGRSAKSLRSLRSALSKVEGRTSG